MHNDFTQEIKSIEQELLALKTASAYASVRSANYTSSANVTTGVYRINYGGSSEQIFSIVSCKAGSGWIGTVFPRTPSGNSQIVEVQTTHYTDSGYVTESCPLSVVSNRPVASIARVS